MKEPFSNLLQRAWVDLHDPEAAWQIAILLSCFALAWAAGRVLRLARVEADGIWKFGVGGLRRILFPVVALIPLSLSISLLKHWVEVDLLRLFVPLLVSLLLVRFFFYLLRHVFARGSIVRTFERAIAVLVWGGLVLHVSGLLPEVIDFFEEITFQIGKQKFSLWLVLQGLFWVVITLLAALWLSGAIEARLMRAESLHSSLRVVFARLARSLLLVRFFFYLLRHVFARGSIVRTFERAIAVLVWGGLVLHVSGLLPEVIDFFEEITFHIGKQKFSLWLVLQGLFWVVITLLAALWLSGAIEARLMRAESLHSSLRVVFARLAKSLLVLVAVLMVLPLLGIDLTVLSVFGGAIGVGLGFGLQKIASNYVSGFIILLDRSIRIGDLITADNFYGEVKDITTRYVVVRAFDGREAIIPNEMLITTTVQNHSYSNRQIRLAIQVQVGYKDDPERAMRLMEEAAVKHPRVLADPPAKAFLARFADSGIELELGVWIDDPESGMLNLRSELNLAIWRAFQEAGIEIPYPQREVRVLPGARGVSR